MKLYIVATPIGNLNDITLRAIDVLKTVDWILCEDTRQTRKLLDHYKISTPVISYHQHSKIKKINQIGNLLNQGKDLALVSDAGTPGISDPGNKLISLTLRQLADLEIIPIPGPSAVTAALSICGFPTDRFIFLGFPPVKKARNKFFKNLNYIKYTIVIYESPYRILKTLNDLLKVSAVAHRQIMVARELTKKFESIYRGNIKKVIVEIKKGLIKGEFVIVIEPKK
ncbi:16S rRNA (cytidine(1402)-2'-O)-methyltransferase [Patescibacteria group bacterium]|nr:16S rRNA (cytidine(1402)-2'-O)-methyltransferase [Patescibacteria group bacterium]